MREFVYDYDDFSFTLFCPPYWDMVYAGKPRERLYHDYCLMMNALKGADKEKYVLDIGMNHGLFAVPAAKLGYKVFGFEPVARNVQSLHLAIEKNELTNFDVFQIALSNENNVTSIYVPECTDNASLSEAAAISNMRSKDAIMEPVETQRFDDWILNHPQYLNIGFIKMDTQGAEYNILEGMKEYLESASDILLICEYEHHTLTMGHTYDQLDKLIASFGFQYISHLTANDKLFYKQ